MEPSQCYPGPAVRVIDDSFAKYRLALASVERIAHGFRWAEGPVWFGDGRYLLWSDIPNNRMIPAHGRKRRRDAEAGGLLSGAGRGARLAARKVAQATL